jgi:hypothetical protein
MYFTNFNIIIKLNEEIIVKKYVAPAAVTRSVEFVNIFKVFFNALN